MRKTSGGALGHVVGFATQGSGHGDEARLEALLGELEAEIFPFDRASKAGSARSLLWALIRKRPHLVVMEGTGVAGGLSLIAAKMLADVPYVVSSGDAVGPYVGLSHRLLSPVAALYERILCRLSAGYVGWTPYLVGRALSFGAPRAMTAAGWSAPARFEDRALRRRELGIPEDAVVFGLVGSLEWTEGIEYCYGLELVRAALGVDRDDLRVVVVGDGTGLNRLRTLAGEEDGERILFPGRVPKEQVTSYLTAFDVASLPQSVDRVGSFRYTTKISEYLAAGLPLVTGQIPLAYDLDDGWIWRLAGESPWDPDYISSLAELMRSLTPAELQQRRERVPAQSPLFDRELQVRRATDFLNDIARSKRPR